MSTTSAPDLTQRPPRSVRTRLGGYALLPRLLDKGRAELAGTNGEFHYDCPNDKRWFQFAGVDAAALKTELATGKGDGEILEWIEKHAKNRREAWEIQQWSDFQGYRTPDSDEESLSFFVKYLRDITKTRADIKTWADLLDLDDHVTFGGKA